MAVEIEEVDPTTQSTFDPTHFTRMMVFSVRWSRVPWHKRLFAVAALPYQFLRFLFTGNADFLMVKNVTVKR